MKRRIERLLITVGLNCLVFCSALAASSEEPIDFRRDIESLFAERCHRCHGEAKQRGGLRLDLRGSVLAGGDSGEPAIRPGEPGASLLFRLVSSEDDEERMPPANAEEAPLTASEVERIRRWIEQGAVWPDANVSGDSQRARGMQVTDDDRQHWSFLPLRSVVPPKTVNASRIQSPVDAFVLQRQEEQGLTLSPPAEPRSIVRRLFFNLIGLPPTREELAHWVEQLGKSPSTVGELVDALLSRPEYGERWARHWLDVARYADSNGMELDADRPNAFRYRDFVIRAMNRDLPFDTFVQWQLAGDELAPSVADAIAATGFLAAGVNTILPDQQMVEEKLRNRANELDDIVSTTGQALLGLTLACARCHDHKYDPLPTRDYYRLTRVFNSGDRAEVPLVSPALVVEFETAMSSWKRDQEALIKKRDTWLDAARASVGNALRAARIEDLPITDEEKRLLLEQPEDERTKAIAKKHEKALRIDDEALVASMPAEAQAVWRELVNHLEAVEQRQPEPLPKAFAFVDFGPEPTETWFFERGDFLARNERMDFGFLSVLTNDKSADEYWKTVRRDPRRNDSTLQRSALALWMTDPDHGAGALLARVTVNRIWQHHFGEGLVRTVSDFGSRGDLPTHPELLEWLAAEFVQSGWSVKHLHRHILRSAAYQQASRFDAQGAGIDPENRFLWRQRPVRLEAEVLRDAMLATGGSLTHQLFGPAFKPPIQIEALQARNVRNPYPKLESETAEAHRRSIYLFHKRVVQYPLLQAFDAPDAQQSCGRRMNTTVAPQALAVLNDPFVRRRAEDLAGRVLRNAGEVIEAQVIHAFEYALNREPDADELGKAIAFLKRQSRERESRNEGQASRLALVDFCHALFGLNEFIYFD